MNSVPGIDELRRRFAIWSLAIFGSLSGSGSVRLESTLWGAEDPPSETQSRSDDKAKSGDAPAASLDRMAFQRAVQSKDFATAAQMLEPELAKDPSGMNIYLNFMLANAMLNAQDPAGMTRMEQVAQQSSDALQTQSSLPLSSAFAMSHQALADRLVSQKKSGEAIELLKDSLKKLEVRGGTTQSGSLVSRLISLLIREDRAGEAKEFADKRFEAALAAVKKNATTNSRIALGSAFAQYSSALGTKFPENVQKAYETIEPMLREAVEGDSGTLGDYSVYQSVQTSAAMTKAESDGAAAMKILEATKEIADKLSERLEAGDQPLLAKSRASLRSAESRIRSKLLHQSLIGQPAPEFDVEAVVNMPKVSMADLKGKVVLIDFWAVWCGPCIATFPHLRDWKKEYGEKGLVIVGVTQQYGYKWDSEKGKQVADKEASLDVELEMLEEFRKSYELEHGFIVTPMQSDYSKKFGVTGIPQAVLIDQNGNVQMIKVGSGEKNAEDLEAKIKSLLGV